MDVEAEFLDGPRRGLTLTFRDREEPPLVCSVYVRGEAQDAFGNVVAQNYTYIRDESPYPDGPRWIYMLATESEHCEGS